MKMLVRKLIAAMCVAVCLPFWSCSTVKEDRTDCPCTLNVNLDDFALHCDSRSVMVQVMGEQLIQKTVNPQDYIGHGYDVEVKRRMNRVSVVSGLDASVVTGDTLAVAEGVEADALYVFSEMVQCEGELASVVAAPLKKWCDVHIVIVGEGTPDNYLCDIVLSAECRGMSLSTGYPSRGEYRALATRTKAGELVVRLPRQEESVVRLDFYERNESREYESSEAVFNMEIGSLMNQQGYDWSKDNLDDIYVYVDHTRMTAIVEVSGWIEEKIQEEI